MSLQLAMALFIISPLVWYPFVDVNTVGEQQGICVVGSNHRCWVRCRLWALLAIVGLGVWWFRILHVCVVHFSCLMYGFGVWFW